MYEIVSILTSGKLKNTEVDFGERFIEIKTNFERTEDETVPTIWCTNIRMGLMPNNVLHKV